jgi:hypothetical protein
LVRRHELEVEQSLFNNTDQRLSLGVFRFMPNLAVSAVSSLLIQFSTISHLL